MSEISLDQKEAQLEVYKQDKAPAVQVQENLQKDTEDTSSQGEGKKEVGQDKAETEGSKYTTESENQSEKIEQIKRVYNK